MEFLDNLFTQIIDLLTSIVDIIIQTTDLLNGINFSESVMAEYLGYARFVFGAPLWALFCIVLLIPLGVTIFVWTLKGIAYIKTLLPN